jgi:bifunctional UDP-N-acetylglucosamine pyrophosphorylase / glucosamine-1-phosphate N-acetyltransferase
MASELSVIILAAGKGTRMRSGLPKVLHPLGDWPLIRHVLAVATRLDAARVVVVLAPGMEDVASEVRRSAPHAHIAIQDPPLGTGHAVMAARQWLVPRGTVLVLYGDTPLITEATAAALLDQCRARDAAVAVLGMEPPDRTGYGRLRMQGDELWEIVEERHADGDLKSSAPCNAGITAFAGELLAELLDALPLRPEKQEYYLTDTVALAHARGWRCTATVGPWEDGLGINSQRQLADAERVFQDRVRERLLAAGVIMPAPETVFFSADTSIASGAVIEPNVVFGLGVNIAAGARIRAFSHLEGATVETGAVVGPFARLRPGAELASNVRIGNFVEVKSAVMRSGAKANHLAYIGDAEVGENANIGAGTITCNYDGAAKHKTMIGPDAFIGSNTALVAPVSIGSGAIIGAGSTITRDVPDEALAVARSRQQVLEGRAKSLRARRIPKSASRPVEPVAGGRPRSLTGSSE